MTAWRLRCFPVVPIDPDARNVWEVEEGRTGFYIQDDTAPYIGSWSAFACAIGDGWKLLRVPSFVHNEPAARIYQTPIGYVGVVAELYDTEEVTK